MLIVLSPAKSLDYASPVTAELHTTPDFIDESAALIDVLRRHSPAQIASLMKISDPLAALNHERYAAWSPHFDTANARQAVLAFNGDVYEGLQAKSLDAKAMRYLQSRLRILSGLYGLLRPLDLMQPYRLEMGTRLKTARGDSLYAWWGRRITDRIVEDVHAVEAGALINLASEEYFKAVRTELLPVPVITPVFEERKNGVYKIISFHAKRARGLMARHAAERGIEHPEDLKAFNAEGYAFDAAASDSNRWVFRRG
ncbi:peroxide stress protein YaaA [Noviherbaspirillum pedocola]|uniref:UPF0246 protein JJB74_16615 n=1 Tax=Noviherbaspirillum pedocola TaxID=2801341 RepID=A0A934T031_9BURK|nr:peroxide stress protein YaaA [Noviherbaspirillum pedocola]MBK4736247.1 peroxide stress protein YaaA [Noviherbaspirillum pedocola]